MTFDKTDWICDKCGKIIQRPEEGWIQWLKVPKPGGDGYRNEGLELVHHYGNERSTGYQQSCLYDQKLVFKTRGATVADLPLCELLGPDGLVRLLAFIAEPEFESRDVIHIIARLFIPGFERVRLHLEEAASAGAFEPSNSIGLPFQFQIELIVDWLKHQN